MYLKALEMVGFKSFADKTRLEFEPGMTAVVGPNGCGKSNVADALRWVLGEQSAKALRGSRMEDCIFNGTDNRKPLGMAEVSVTFAGCEGVLNTEFNEVTVTRRVFRSGEGQYFINKTPCRLKDIQRLFMDTGIGTSSYSMMEQGRIDAILSARPEDRRTIFEEASGITKFKADKKEAIRKLEHTEANLLRLSDVIREVKRQIGSLQRQAGKARRYKEIQDELRKLDLHVTRQRLQTADREIVDVEARLGSLTEQLETLQQEVRGVEKDSAAQRESLSQLERDIGGVLEAGVQARSRLAHTREMIEMNRQRVAEYRVLSERDSREIDQTGKQLDEQRHVLDEQTARTTEAKGEKALAEKEWRTAAAHLEQHRSQVERLRSSIQALRDESVELESMSARLQNQLIEMEARERSTIIQREKHAAEKGQLARVVETFGQRQEQLKQELEDLRTRTTTDEQALAALESERAAKSQTLDQARQEAAGIGREMAALQSRIDLLEERDASADGYSEGSRRLLRKASDFGVAQERVVGALAAHLDVPAAYRVALETSLRAWIDAVVVRDQATALELAEQLSAKSAGAARLIALGGAATAAVSLPDGDRLSDRVRCSEDLKPALASLIGNILVVDNVAAIPRPIPAGVTYVTRHGILATSQGLVDVWLQQGDSAANPLARRRLLADSRQDLGALEARDADCRNRLGALGSELEALNRRIQEQRSTQDQSRRALAQKEGEAQIVTREAREAAARLETVTWELESLTERDHSGHQERQQVNARLQEVQEQRRVMATDIAGQSQSLRVLEDEQTRQQASVTDLRIRHEGLNQRVAHLAAQHDSTSSRIRDLETALAGRTRGIQAYAESMQKLTETIASAEGQLASMEEAVETVRQQTEDLQARRAEQTTHIRATEELLANKRAVLEDRREARSATEIQLTECRMRRQNQVDRVSSEYALTLDQLQSEPEHEFPDGVPPFETLDALIAELRTKLDAMGPVNLVAIEEYKELEERFSFLTTQEQDLVNAKQQLMDMIRNINRTTSEMFSSTFLKVNENFQNTFNKLFNGGSAKLVLVNEEDVLECGIDIIARPPGKRLQNVSLLSGGERTMTAVALLFAIYMIKPSPFCMLDELDAALDEANVGRFVSILTGFLNQSQFLVITHNRLTISTADILYGVTMPDKGISKIVSMRFRHRESPGAAQPAATPSPPSPGPAPAETPAT